jgi:hypothetical protein
MSGFPEKRPFLTLREVAVFALLRAFLTQKMTIFEKSREFFFPLVYGLIFGKNPTFCNFRKKFPSVRLGKKHVGQLLAYGPLGGEGACVFL